MRNALFVVILLLPSLFLASCHYVNPTEKQIIALQRQVSTDAEHLERLAKNEHVQLKALCARCDSLLQYAPESQLDNCFNVINLTNAYLIQFSATKPLMESKLIYSERQLRDLLNDLTTDYITDSLAVVYLSDEQKVSDTLHQQILYFQDRFDVQKAEIAKIEKTLRR